MPAIAHRHERDLREEARLAFRDAALALLPPNGRQREMRQHACTAGRSATAETAGTGPSD